MTSFTPVLELDPASFALRTRALPPGSVEENPDGWLAYWCDSLRDAGITGLQPWAPGSWLVPLQRLSEESTSKAILRAALSDVESWDLEEIGALAGGFVLSHNGTQLLPGCCGDLGNLEEWERAVAHEHREWLRVWIGHPWTHVRAEGDLLEFAVPTEEADPAGLIGALQIPREALVRAIEPARRELDVFAQRLLPMVQDFTHEVPAQDLVQVLVYGH